MCGVCTEFGIWPTFTKALPESDEDVVQEDEIIETLELVPPEHTQEFPVEEKHDSAIQRLTPDPVQTLRFTWQKKGSLKYIGHLDWMRLIQRAIRLSKLPVAYTKGYNPRSMISFGPALPLFVEALADIVDVSLYETISLDGILEKINPHMPEDAQVTNVEAMTAHSTSIEKMLQSMHYFAITPCTNSTTEGMIREQLKTLIHEPHWMVEAISKKRGAYTLDIKPYVQQIQIQTQASSIRLDFQVERANPLITGGTLWVKPDWVLDYLAPELPWQVTRQSLALGSLTSSQEDVTLMSC